MEVRMSWQRLRACRNSPDNSLHMRFCAQRRLWTFLSVEVFQRPCDWVKTAGHSFSVKNITFPRVRLCASANNKNAPEWVWFIQEREAGKGFLFFESFSDSDYAVWIGDADLFASGFD